jgi:tyrosyl-tRNA synthetase
MRSVLRIRERRYFLSVRCADVSKRPADSNYMLLMHTGSVYGGTICRRALATRRVFCGRVTFAAERGAHRLPTVPRALTKTYSAQINESRSSASLDTACDLLSTLKARGLYDNCTDEVGLLEALRKPVKVYCGFDPTADSLHLGNLLGIVILAWFQKAGHHPVSLVGGATGRVGDPSGRSLERPLLSEDALASNVSAIRSLLEKLLADERGSEPTILNNYDWFQSITLLDFLRDTGKFARMGTMLSKDSVRTRLESEEGLSFTEFSYQLLQGYDFMHLFREQGVSVQIGGSDQWGNITAGTDLIRRVCREDGAYGMTFPLLLKSDGTKFGKSATGAIWLSKERLSPYKFYQYLLQTTDSDVVRLLRMLTFLPLDDISRIEANMQGRNYIPNSAQTILAEELTKFVHGPSGLKEAQLATACLKPGSDTPLDSEALSLVAELIPTVTLNRSSVIGTPIITVLVDSGLLDSKGAAKRLVLNGGVRLNNVKVHDMEKVVRESDIIGDNMLVLSSGKKNKLLIRLE